MTSIVRPSLFRSAAAHSSLAVSFLLLACGAQGDFDVEATEQIGDGVQVASSLDPLAAGLGLTLSSSPDSIMEWYNEGVDGFDPAVGAGGKLTMGSNSQVTFPRNTRFGDIDGDRKADAVQWNENKLFINRLDADRTEVAHLFLPFEITDVLIGDFIGAGWDQVCAVSSEISCYGVDPAKDDQLRFWFRSMIPFPNRDMIVGNFDGDAQDEVFTYNPSTGEMGMYQVSFTAFSGHPSWTRGNLSRVATSGVQFRAGDLNGDGRTDLVARKPNGQLEFFGSVSPQAGQHTFWFHFSTVGGFMPSNRAFFLARVNDDLKAELVIHNPATGALSAHKVSEPAASPPTISNKLDTTRISLNTSIAMTSSHEFRDEPGAQNRDDVLIYDADNDNLYNYEARYTGDAHGYTKEYQVLAPNNDEAWGAPNEDKVLFLRCQFKGTQDKPRDADWLDFVHRVQDYYYEVTFGEIDMSSSDVVANWIQMSLTADEVYAQAAADEADADNDDRSPRYYASKECIRAAGKNASNYDRSLVVLNLEKDMGASGTHAVLNPSSFNIWTAVHELGHTFGIPDGRSVVSGKYTDPFDPMSAQSVGFTYTNPIGMRESAGFSGPQLKKLKALPSKKRLNINGDSPAATLTLSALNRPGGENVQIEVERAEGDVYSLEYREQTGFDRTIRRPTVLFYRNLEIVDEDGGEVKRWSTYERTVGESVSVPDVGSFEILSFDTNTHVAKIAFTPN